MYDALTSRYTFACPVRGETHVRLSAFREVERLPGSAHPAVFSVRFACECGDDHLGLVVHPELDWDRAALARIAAGNLKSLIGYHEDELDDKGNIELRCWACAAGALGERMPDIVSLDPSWHHNYASLAWFGSGDARRDLHYPSIKPELVGLTTALHGLAHEASARAEFLAEVVYYNQVAPRQGARFAGAVEEATVRALTFPLSGSPSDLNARRVVVIQRIAVSQALLFRRAA